MYKENIIRLILDMEKFMSKKGDNIEAKRKLIDSINIFTKSTKLRSIYVNNTDNYLLPDIFVMPMYNKNVGTYLVDTDENLWYENDYTIEIHDRCFNKYSSEELIALLLNAILQNILSTTAKTRFLMSYDNAMNKYKDSVLLNTFDNVKFSEVAYLIFMDICARPFVITNTQKVENIISVVPMDVIDSFNLREAFDLAAVKYNNDPSVTDPSQLLEVETKKDNNSADSLLQASVRGEIRYYTDMFKIKYPLITVKNILELKDIDTGLGFGDYNKRGNISKDKPLSENTITEIDLQYKMDKIITAMRYAESEDERTALLYKIRLLRIDLTKTINKIESKNKNPDKHIKTKLDFLISSLKELDDLRTEIVKMEIKPKKFGVFIKYPDGYDY